MRTITTDYSERSKDILILQDVSPDKKTTQPVTLRFGSPSSFCAGIQKVAQRYLVMFMTMLGSQRYYPTFGTEFLSKLTVGNLARIDFIHLFNFANARILNKFREYDEKNKVVFDDEKLESASLENIIIDNKTGSVKLRVKLLTKAGENASILIPLPVNS